MFSCPRAFNIEWGECDPAGIVYYPRYMVDTGAKFFTPTRYGDVVTMASRISLLNRSGLGASHRLTRAARATADRGA